MVKHESSPGNIPAKNEYGIEAGQILMQNIQECLTVLWPVTGESSRRTARFAVSISASLTAGLTTSVDMGNSAAFGKTGFFKKKIMDFLRVVSHFFSQKLNMSESFFFISFSP